MVKEKLTLSVDKEVIEKAKKLGINISDITEKILKGYTSAKKPEKEGGLYEGYKMLFDSITPLLKEFGVSVMIAEDYFADDKGNKYHFDICLEPDGSFYSDVLETSFRDIRKIDLRAFLPPKEILAKLVDALVRSEEIKKEKMKEILMAKRIIDAMTETIIGKKLQQTGMHHKERTKS